MVVKNKTEPKKKPSPRSKKTPEGYKRKPSPRPHNGGARKGAGRKPGATTVRTKEIADKIMKEEGESPLEYMIRVMRQDDKDLEELEQSGGIDTAEKIKLIVARDHRRDWAAEKAAPYIHPKLSSIQLDANVAVHEQWLDELD